MQGIHGGRWVRSRMARFGLAIAATGAMLSACAPMVKSEPVLMAARAAGAPAGDVTLAEPASFKLSTGYGRELRAGSRWRAVGTVPAGTVYRPVDGVFSIEGRDVHEAYLVVSRGTLRGFYLPAESRFAPLDSPIQLKITGEET